jgi:hypothetical protein
MLTVKVFSATKAEEREQLGSQITEWMRANKCCISDIEFRQSSDSGFHCLSATVFAAASAMPPAIWYDGKCYESVEVYSATMHKHRDAMGARIAPLHETRDRAIVLQSSDEEFHCLTIIVLRGSR